AERITGAWYEFTDALRLAGRPVPPHLAATEAAAFASTVAPAPPAISAPPATASGGGAPPATASGGGAPPATAAGGGAPPGSSARRETWSRLRPAAPRT